MTRYNVSRRIVAMSRVYQHGKTQIPSDVRKILGIKDGDKILWIQKDNEIYIKKPENAVH